MPCKADTDERSAGRAARARRLAGLYAVTPDIADTALLLSRVEAALIGGAGAVQYRSKSSDASLRRDQAASLARLTATHGRLFIVNDDAALAAAAGADGVHLGEDDGSVAEARELIGPDAIVGVSCYNRFDLAEAAAAAGADYVAFGSFFPSSVKPGARRAGLALLERAKTLGIPVVAIGGITASNAPALARAGAQDVAVISAVFDASDVEAAARSIAAVYL